MIVRFRIGGCIILLILSLLICHSDFIYAQFSWAHSYSITNYKLAYINQTSDGGFIVAGEGYKLDNATGSDCWILKLNFAGTIEWQKAYSGNDDDNTTAMQQTSDGGYIAAGYTGSFGAGDYDFYVLKLDSEGGISWQKTFGGSGTDHAQAIQQTGDGGYIVAGYTNSFGAGNYDYWVLKLNSSGAVTWQRSYGGTGDDYAQSIRQTGDGGYIVAGYTNSFGTGNYDYWVLKLNSSGAVTWQETYGGTGDDYAQSIQQTGDGGYIIAGYTNSFGAGNYDYWVLKLNASGAVTWQNSYGGSGNDYAKSIRQNSSGGYVVAGYTNSFGAGYDDFWVLGLNASGAVIWQKTYGGSSYDSANSIEQTTDGGYVIAGWTSTFGTYGSGLMVLKTYADGSMHYSCDFVASTNVIAIPSIASANTTNAAPMASSVAASDASVAAVNTTAIDTMICSSCSAPYGLGNITVEDIDTCANTGLRITWPADPTDWADAGYGTRTYAILRDGSVIASGLSYGTTTYIDTNATESDYKVRYVNGCGTSNTTYYASGADYPLPPSSEWLSAYDKSPLLDTGVYIYWPVPMDWGDQGLNIGNRRFKVYRDSIDISGPLSASNLSFTDTTGVNNTYYTYNIEAINGCGAASFYYSTTAIDVVTNVGDWAYIYGFSGYEAAASIEETGDGGFIVAGGIDNLNNMTSTDYWIVKLTSSGGITWQYSYGGAMEDMAQSIKPTSDGGFIIAGNSRSFGAGNYDIWVLKLDSLGMITWQYSYGGANNDYAYAVQQTSEGGYIVAGYTNSFGAGGYDILVLKLDSSGTVTWQKTYGGTGNDYAYAIEKTTDGGYIISGSTASFGNYDDNYWILKLTSSGAVTWQKLIYSLNYYGANSIQQTADGGYIVAGSALYIYNNSVIWVLKLSSSGAVTWEYAFIGPANFSARSVRQTSDGGYIVAANGESYYSSTDDIWVIKLTSTGAVSWQYGFGGLSDEWVSAIRQTSDGGYVIAGTTSSFNAEGSDHWIFKINQYGTMHSSCSFIWDYDITQEANNAAAINTNASVNTPALSIAGTSVSATPTAANTELICPACQEPNYLVENTAIDFNKCANSGIQVGWNADVENWGDDDTGTRTYDVLRDGVPIATGLPYGTTSYIDTNTTAEQIYHYAVSYVNGCGFSRSTYGVNASDKDDGAPSLMSTYAWDDSPVFDTGVDISWEIPDDWGDSGINAENRGFRIYRGTVDISGFLPASVLSMNDNTGINGTLYWYHADAINGCGRTTSYFGMNASDEVEGSFALIQDSVSIDDSGGNNNQVWDMGESIDIETSWYNIGPADASGITGSISTISPIDLLDQMASYGSIIAESSKSCATAYDCYSATATGPRPSVHWDAIVHESLNVGNEYDWILHIGNSFSDVPASNVFYYFIESLLHSGVTGGCTAIEYCPKSIVSREQMAKFVCSAMNVISGSSCTIGSCNGIFSDVPGTNIFCPYIEGLYNANIISGCQTSPLLYCPQFVVQRQAMAKFICLGMNKVIPGSCLLNGCMGIFNDVQSDNLFCPYIEALNQAGVVTGCQASPPLYCPLNNVTREQMAKFIINAFDFTLY